MGQDYYLGIDMGVASLGWCVTDSNYHIMKKNGKALWGVRLFDSALTAEERRAFRTNRRRLDRRNWRIQILQELFSEEISKVDPGFFLRMKESKYYPEDKADIAECDIIFHYTIIKHHNGIKHEKLSYLSAYFGMLY